MMYAKSHFTHTLHCLFRQNNNEKRHRPDAFLLIVVTRKGVRSTLKAAFQGQLLAKSTQLLKFRKRKKIKPS